MTDRFVIDDAGAVLPHLRPPASPRAFMPSNNVSGDFRVKDPAGNDVTSEFAFITRRTASLEIAKRPCHRDRHGGEKQHDGKQLTAADTGYDIGGEAWSMSRGRRAPPAARPPPGAPRPLRSSLVVAKDGDVDVANQRAGLPPPT